MSLNLPSRRLLRSASALTPSTSSPSATTLLPALQSLSLTPSTNCSGPSAPSLSRSFHTTSSRPWFWNRKTSSEASSSPLEQQASGTAEVRKRYQDRLLARTQAPSIFKDEIDAARTDPASAETASGRRQQKKDSKAYTVWGGSTVTEHIARAADPDPRSRVRWERKMVIRQVRRGTDPFSREPRAERIARTERELTSKSPYLPTSVKKLVHLARQIKGKTVEDALVQMRYSHKKMAREVRVQLEQARDMAVVERGMGIGLGVDSKKAEAEGPPAEVKIQTKDGKFLKIDNPTRIYVSEAWVNRGPLRGKRIRYVARGRMNLLKKPSTSISIVLKEEKTRIREHEERVAKKFRQGPWVHLPDRPVTAQRQYYSW